MTLSSNEDVPNNYILSLLPDRELGLLRPHCELVHLHMGDEVETAGEPVQFLFFPIDAAISFTGGDETGRTVDVTVTGKDGCSGSCIAQGSDKSASTALIQISGSAVRLPASVLKDHLADLRFLREALIRYNLLLLRHAVISTSCSQFHTLEQRLGRWLVAHAHRTGLEAFPFSMPFMAGQVGADAQSVEAILKGLAAEGMVQIGKNRVTLVDSSALTKRACPCVGLAEQATEEYRMSVKQLL